jgi:hypothetical protein
METMHEPLHLDKLSFVQGKLMDMPYLQILLDEAFKHSGGAKF